MAKVIRAHRNPKGFTPGVLAAAVIIVLWMDHHARMPFWVLGLAIIVMLSVDLLFTHLTKVPTEVDEIQIDDEV